MRRAITGLYRVPPEVWKVTCSKHQSWLSPIYGYACAIGIALLMYNVSSLAASQSVGPETAPSSASLVLHPLTVVTHHVWEVGGGQIHYTAVASKIILRDFDDKPTASMFYISYTKDGANPDARPVTFVYDGGPGVTSTGLEMVGFGPKLVVTTNAAHTPPAPYKIIDNPYSLLNKTDLVFIEEVGAGYSRLLGDAKISQFAGVDQDAESFEQFITRYLNKYKRWNSPKYLMGNSYGTTRDAVLADDLQEAGIDLQGVILISTVLNFQTLEFSPGNDLPYILFLPTYAAIAHYHHALTGEFQSESLQKLLNTVQSFATGEYAHFLLLGDMGSSEEQADVAQKLSEYTGLSEQFIRYSNFRVNESAFRKELLRSRNLGVGRTDGRFVGPDYDQAATEASHDPLDSAISGPYTASMNYLLVNVLHYNIPTELWRSSCYAICHWDWSRTKRFRGVSGGFSQGYADVSIDLRRAMIDNPQLKLFVAYGYYDLACPYFAAWYDYDHLNIGSLQKNITMKGYHSGHVMYLRPQTHAHIYKDLENFYASSIGG